MRTLVGEGIGAFIVVGHEHSLVGSEVFSFWKPPWSMTYGILSLWESLWTRWSVGSKLFHDAWVARKYLINVIHLETILQLQSRHFMKASAYWRRQPLRNITFRELQGFPWPTMNRWELGWRDISVSQYRRRHPIWSSVYSFCPHISFCSSTDSSGTHIVLLLYETKPNEYLISEFSFNITRWIYTSFYLVIVPYPLVKQNMHQPISLDNGYDRVKLLSCHCSIPLVPYPFG